MGHETHQKMIDAMNKCVVDCNHCLSSCLKEQDVKSLSRCIQLDMDCADFCHLLTVYAARGSEYTMHLMKHCADICDACATECEKFSDRYDHCKKCAETCRACANECRSMA